MNTISKVGFLLVLSCQVGCTEATLSVKQIEALKNVSIGNGLAFHPTGQILLISKPSEVMDQISGKHVYNIYQLTWDGTSWSGSHLLSINSKYQDYHPVFSPDGKWIYFNSNRPAPGDSLSSDKVNIWRVSFREGQLGVPEYLSKINTDNHESYPSITSDGTLYFNSDRPGGLGSMDIYRAECDVNGFETPVLVSNLNSADSENDLTISPDEQFMILNRYHFDSGEISMYVSYREEGEWTTPTLIKEVNQKGKWELTPTFSPDGKFFFFELDGKIKTVKMDTLFKDSRN